MNRIDLYKLQNGKLRCDVFSENNEINHLSDAKSKELMLYIEESLYENEYSISYKKDTFCITVDNTKIYVHDYKRINKELKKYMPETLDEINEHYKKNDKKKVIKAKKAAKRTGLIMAFTLTSILVSTQFKFITTAKNSQSEQTITFIDPVALSDNNPLELHSINDSKVNETESEIQSNQDTEEDDYNSVYNYSIDIDCADHSKDADILELQLQYKDTVDKLAQKWGVSPSLIMGMMTQESHCIGNNLMQIQSWSILDEVMTVYNFNTNQYVSYVVTNNPGKYSNTITTISPKELTNSFTNISVATIYYRHIINRYTNGNPLTAIEVYNKGIANFNTNLNAASKKTGKSIYELTSDLDDTTFTDYSYVCGQGDSNYISNVMQYVDGGFYVKMLDENNQIYTITYDINKTQERGLKY